MIELLDEKDYNYEEGVSFPIYLPDCALRAEGDVFIEVAGEALGEFFAREYTYPFRVRSVRIVPELPLNQVIGIPSLEGKIFGGQE